MAWEARGEWGGVGVLDATSDAAQIWVRSSGDLGEQILCGWDRVRSGQPPGGAAGVGGDHVCKGQQGRVYSKHSGLLSAGEVGAPSRLTSPACGMQGHLD